MKLQSSCLLVAAVAVVLCTSPVVAINRLLINNDVYQAGQNGLETFVLCDNEFDVYAISLAIKFDPNIIEITAVEPAGIAADAEWDAGSGLNQIDNVQGELIYGFLTEYDFTGGSDNVIPVGTAQLVAKITFNTMNVARTSTKLDLLDGIGDIQGGSINALVSGTGTTFRAGSVNPLTLTDGNLTIDPFTPIISNINPDEGGAGTVITITGQHFDKGTLDVRIDNRVATFTRSGQVLTVTVPACPTCPADVDTCVDVEITNENGSTTEPGGFCYEALPVPTINSIAPATGSAGTLFFVSGSNFALNPTTVTVCDIEAQILVISDTSIQVTAPDCPPGDAEVEVCNRHGCVARARGFIYPAGPGQPEINSIAGNTGTAGNTFVVAGANFLAAPPLTIQVCGVDASFIPFSDTSLQVTAPECDIQGGWAPMRICTEVGCVNAPNGEGFFYEETPAPLINSIAGNTGTAGTTFVVAGANFLAAPNLTVQVCNVAASFIPFSDSSLQVTAPPCATQGAFAPLRICTDAGCASAPNGEGFFYEELPGGLFIRGNANDDFAVDVSDAIAILSDLFLGIAADAPCRDALDVDDSGELDVTDPINLLGYQFLGSFDIPSPFPNAGPDPTDDILPACAE